MLTAKQLQDVLNALPRMSDVEGDYFRVSVREYPEVSLGGLAICRERPGFCEFEKTPNGWALVSLPRL